jgi:addiction module RelE/StbE family toxin
MHLIEGRNFEKQYAKLPKEVQVKARERVHLLVTDNTHPLLNDHKLNPPYDGCRSINITGDYRLVYKKLDENTYYLRAIGTHHQLYGS